MTTTDAAERVVLAAGVVCVNAVQLPPDDAGRPSDFIVPRLDMLELIAAQAEVYRARKAERDERRQRERETAEQPRLVA